MTYPYLEECWDLLLADQGLTVGRTPLPVNELLYTEGELIVVDQELGTLTKEDRETAAIGEHSDAAAILIKLPHAELVQMVLEAMFAELCK